MLKKSLRLGEKRDFSKVFCQGKSTFFNELGCKYLVVPQPSLRLGFVFSKKHLPLATQRNRLRRVLSEAFFQLQNKWPAGVDIVLFTIKKPKKINTQINLPIIRHFLEHIKKNLKTI